MGRTMSNIGETIRNLRDRMGVRQEKLAEWIGISRATLAQVENGNRKLESLELFRAADFFGCTVSDLLNKEVMDLEAVGVRFRTSLDIREDDAVWEVVAKSIKLARETFNLKKILEVDSSELYIPTYSIRSPANKKEAVRQGYQIALKERSRLGLGSERIENIGELIEAEGIYAGVLEMPYDISGFTISLEDVGSICMVNEKHSGLRRRFSLAHEYGHAIMDSELGAVVSKSTEKDELLEVRANVFAAGFLMPEAGCREMIRKIGKGSASRESAEVFDGKDTTRIEVRNRAEDQLVLLIDVARLAFYFGVSIQAMLYRLKNIGMISQARLEVMLREEAGEAGEHLRKLMHRNDLDNHLEEPDLFRCTVINLALEALRRECISRSKCLEVGNLACEEDQFEIFSELVDETSQEYVQVILPGEDLQ